MKTQILKWFKTSCIVLFALVSHTSHAQAQPTQKCVNFGFYFGPDVKNANCDLEVCIIQTLDCVGQEPVAFLTCSTFRPNETGKLCFMAFDEVNGDCTLSVTEVKIKRVNTGETISLNATTFPATAQDFFDHATRAVIGPLAVGSLKLGCDGRLMVQSHTIAVDSTFDPAYMLMQ